MTNFPLFFRIATQWYKRCPTVFLFIGLALICLKSSCRNPTPENKATYFDLAAFLDNEVRRLNEDSFFVRRHSIIGRRQEIQPSGWVDWSKELALFYRSDINKQSFQGRYQVDTLVADTQKRITYRATDSLLHTQLLEVSWEGEKLISIRIVSRTSDFFSSTRQELFLVPMQHYRIHTFVTNRFWGNQEIRVWGIMLPRPR